MRYVLPSLTPCCTLPFAALGLAASPVEAMPVELAVSLTQTAVLYEEKIAGTNSHHAARFLLQFGTSWVRISEARSRLRLCRPNSSFSSPINCRSS